MNPALPFRITEAAAATRLQHRESTLQLREYLLRLSNGSLWPTLDKLSDYELQRLEGFIYSRRQHIKVISAQSKQALADARANVIIGLKPSKSSSKTREELAAERQAKRKELLLARLHERRIARADDEDAVKAIDRKLGKKRG